MKDEQSTLILRTSSLIFSHWSIPIGASHPCSSLKGSSHVIQKIHLFPGWGVAPHLGAAGVRPVVLSQEGRCRCRDGRQHHRATALQQLPRNLEPNAFPL